MFYELIKSAPQHERHFRDWDLLEEEDDPDKWSRVLGRPNLNQNLLSRPTNAVGGCPSFRFYLIARKEGRKQKGFPIRSALGRGILAACTFPLEGTPPLMGNAKTHRESRETHPVVLSQATFAIRVHGRLFDYWGTRLTRGGPLRLLL